MQLYSKDRKLPHYQGQQLGKRHEAALKKKVPETIIFSSFSLKGRTQCLFPTFVLLSHGSGTWHVFLADCLIVVINRNGSKTSICANDGAPTRTPTLSVYLNTMKSIQTRLFLFLLHSCQELARKQYKKRRRYSK